MRQDDIQKFMKIMVNIMKANFDSDLYNAIPRKQFMLMKVIEDYIKKNNDGITVSQLANIFEISRPAISQMLNTVEEKGYITRINQKDDRRVVKIIITQEGYKEIKDTTDKHVQYMAKVFDELGNEKTTQLISLLDELHCIVERQKQK